MSEQLESLLQDEDRDKIIGRMMAKFAEDYDLSSMNYNDKLALEALCNLYIQAQDNMEKISDLKETENWGIIPKIVDTHKDVIKGIETLERQLGISRKARGKEETTVLDYIDSLLNTAEKFLETKLNYLYCPECNVLLATIWVLYPEENNELNLICGRCENSTVFLTKDFTEETMKVIQER